MAQAFRYDTESTWIHLAAVLISWTRDRPKYRETALGTLTVVWPAFKHVSCFPVPQFLKHITRHSVGPIRWSTYPDVVHEHFVQADRTQGTFHYISDGADCGNCRVKTWKIRCQRDWWDTGSWRIFPDVPFCARMLSPLVLSPPTLRRSAELGADDMLKIWRRARLGPRGTVGSSAQAHSSLPTLLGFFAQLFIELGICDANWMKGKLSGRYR